jgi:putative phage-type endonuclease
MIIIDVLQGTDEWHKWRKQFVTASVLPAIIGDNPYESRYTAIQHLRGLREKKVSEWFTSRGNALECPARRTIEDRTGLVLLPLCGESSKTPYMAASFDGVDGDFRPHEIKAPHENVWNSVIVEGRKSAAFRMYYWQVLAQMYVCESDTGFLHFYYNGKLKSFEIKLNPDDLKRLLAAAKEAHDHVSKHTLPKPEPGDCYIPEGQEASAFMVYANSYKVLMQEYRTKKKAYESEQRKVKLAEQALNSYGGRFTSVIADNISITRYQRKGSIDVEVIAKLLSQKSGFDEQKITQIIEFYRKAGSKQVRITDSNVTRNASTEVPDETTALQPLIEGQYILTDKEENAFSQQANIYRAHKAAAKDLEAKMKASKLKAKKTEDFLLQIGLGFKAVECSGLLISRFERQGAIDAKLAIDELSRRLDLSKDVVTSAFDRSKTTCSEVVRFTDKQLSKSKAA